MNLLGVFRRKREVDDGAFDARSRNQFRASGRGALETRLPLPPATTALIGQVAGLVVAFGVLAGYSVYTRRQPQRRRPGGVDDTRPGSSLVLGGLNPAAACSLRRGIRVERLFGSKAVAWWDVTAVRANQICP